MFQYLSPQVSETFTLRYIGCPSGFHLSSDSYQCECETRVEVLLCDLAKEFVLLDVSLESFIHTHTPYLKSNHCLHLDLMQNTNC